MGYANIQADSNFYRQSLNADGVKYVTGPYTSLYEDVFRAVTVTTDSVVSVTSYVGDSLSNQFLLAGTEIYGLFSSVTIHSGKAVLHLAGASYISEIINQYSASGIPLGFYEEGTQCLSQKISALLTQGVFDDASWVMVPSQYEEDWVRAFKPTSELGNLAFTRSSDATFTDSTGVVRRSPYNLLPQSEDFSDYATWVRQQINVSSNVAANPLTGVVNADLLIPDTTNNLHRIYNFATAPNSNVLSVYAKASGYNYISLGHSGGVSGSSIIFNLSNGTVSGTVSGFSGTISPAGNDWYLCSLIQNQATNNYQYLSRWIIIRDNSTNDTFTGNGTSGVLVANAQLVEGSEALPYFATTDRLNVPRLDYRNADGTLSTCPRLLLEPQRTNGIRNSSMVGAVAGTPGTLPTNYGEYLSGLTRTVVGIGTENGLPFIDLRFNGNATSGAVTINFDNSSAIAAAPSQTWNLSSYAKLISGTINTAQLAWDEFNSSLGYIATKIGTVTIGSNLSRVSYTNTTSANCAFVNPQFRVTLTIGAAYDFTIRIAAPQMELGAYATTWVPTTTTAVTRLVDKYSRNDLFTNGLVSAAGGTLILDLRIPFALRDNGNENISISDSTGQNQLFIYGGVSGNTYIFGKFLSGTFYNVYTSVANPANNIKIAIKWNGTSADMFQNGVKVVSATAFTATTSLQLLRSSSGGVGSIVQINQMLLAPTPLSDAECIALTTL